MQRIVVLSTIFAILTTVGLHWNDERWWCILVLLILLEFLAHSHGMQVGTMGLLEMHKVKLMHLKDLYDRNEKGENVSLTDLRKTLDKDEKDD